LSTYNLNRKDNALVLSETLNGNAIQTLLDLCIEERFPKQCNEWHAAEKEISDMYSRERTERQRILFEELASKEDEMRRVLRDAVVRDVMELFPCVLFVVRRVIEHSGHRP
jgi:hypothetical protein